MNENVIGRVEEKKLLNKLFNSKKSEFVAVYGRRRVGKTFLIREFFDDKIVFQASGLANSGTGEQLKSFFQSIKRYDVSVEKMPEDWLDAFELLICYLTKLNIARKVVFLDELPWMDTPNSGFLSALEHFWNGWHKPVQ